MTINLRGKLLELDKPIVMGILNITPDSFYDGGKYHKEGNSIDRITQLIEEGADIIDIGAMSSRPGAMLLEPEIEWERLEPHLIKISQKFPDTVFSLDTIHAKNAERAFCDYGISIINDISGGELDRNMFATIAKHNIPYILMHMRGTPKTMKKLTNYDNIIEELLLYFSKKINELNQMGVSDIIIDPGFGFSKTINQNYFLLNHLNSFKIMELPILVGLSRKSMIYKLLNISPAESLNATQVLNTIAVINGANILRVHDVKQAVEMVKIIEKLQSKA